MSSSSAAPLQPVQVTTVGYSNGGALPSTWDDPPNNPSAVGAISAMARAIRAARALDARGRTSCKRVAYTTPNLMLALLRLVPQVHLLGATDPAVSCAR